MLLKSYQQIRDRSSQICSPLRTEDYVVQPVVDVSPPKWHLGHTTWFFETFFLKPFVYGYQEFNTDYNFVFNSYYETIGNRVIRTDRGNLSRPTVEEVYQYRHYVDQSMEKFIGGNELTTEQLTILETGLNHEQQHQELLYTDIKYILGHNPLFPPYSTNVRKNHEDTSGQFVKIPKGNYEIGFTGDGFCFDNELGRHTVYLNDFEIRTGLVSNAEYLEFINDGGYRNFRYWHSEGWEWVKTGDVQAPLYWHKINGDWFSYTLAGLKPLDLTGQLCHISYYEACAFAEWKGLRLPTESEWEIASEQISWGNRWEWTNSAYLAYPGYKKAEGALGEYNGKFMVNQMVLRGASEVTCPGHSRKTYRNFFHPHLRWQFTGIRLAK